MTDRVTAERVKEKRGGDRVQSLEQCAQDEAAIRRKININQERYHFCVSLCTGGEKTLEAKLLQKLQCSRVMRLSCARR